MMRGDFQGEEVLEEERQGAQSSSLIVFGFPFFFSLLKMILTEMLNQGGGGVRGRVGSMQLWAGERGGGGLMGR